MICVKDSTMNLLMKTQQKTFMALAAFALSMAVSARTGHHLFDFGWQFTRDGKTETVDLPHDWDIFEGPVSG